jgi:hypothetical protein
MLIALNAEQSLSHGVLKVVPLIGDFFFALTACARLFAHREYYVSSS